MKIPEYYNSRDWTLHLSTRYKYPNTIIDLVYLSTRYKYPNTIKRVGIFSKDGENQIHNPISKR
jgi:hypothetical protein